MNRDKNGFVIFDDDFRREMMTPEQFALSNRHRDEFKELLAKLDSGEISEQEYNKITKEMESRHSSEYDALMASEKISDSHEVLKFCTKSFSTKTKKVTRQF